MTLGTIGSMEAFGIAIVKIAAFSVIAAVCLRFAADRVEELRLKFVSAYVTALIAAVIFRAIMAVLATMDVWKGAVGWMFLGTVVLQLAIWTVTVKLRHDVTVVVAAKIAGVTIVLVFGAGLLIGAIVSITGIRLPGWL